MQDRIVDPEALPQEEMLDFTFRPKRLEEVIGQEKVKEHLSIFIRAAMERGEPLEHVLLVGPKGLGKTMFANVIASEMGVNIKITNGAVLERLELSAILTTMNPGDVLFIDEIHRVSPKVQEILYPAMEDYALDIVIGQGGPGARPVRIPLPHFTLVGATTKEGMLTGPLRDRFGVHLRLDYYELEELRRILERDARLLNVEMDAAASVEIARRARGTPRVAKRYLRRIRDYSAVKGTGVVTEEIACVALDSFGVDECGLEDMDRRIIQSIVERDGFASLNTIASAVSEDERTIEDTYEPFLIHIGFLSRTSKGRTLTRKACEYLGIPPIGQTSLFT